MDWSPVVLTLQLALLSTLVLLVLGVPLALWLVSGRSRFRTFIHAVVALPLVLPPTVLGFYLLLWMAPRGWLGQVWGLLSDGSLVFSFGGLLIGSVVYSMPFVVQPLVGAFSAVPKSALEAAASLGARPLDRVFSVVLPSSRAGLIVAAVLGFAHTLGEFGVVLMIGGNIPSRTRVLSIAIYEHVEAQDYAQAHLLSAGLVAFSLLVLLLVYSRSGKAGVWSQ
jgi:molybdate transport system permease protein